MITTGENLKGVSGIYCAIHRASGMCYVGSTANIGKRFGEHVREAQRGRRHSMFYRMLREFGVGAFDFDVLERCPPSVMVAREEFYIALMDAASVRGMNTIRKPTTVIFGRPVSDVTRERKSLASKGRKDTPEARANRKLAQDRMSPEARARVDAARASANKERRISEAQKARLRECRLGTKLSDETRAKISAGGKGRKDSIETCLRRARSQLNRKFSKETRERMRLGVQKRPPISEETRALIAENSRKAWVARKAMQQPLLAGLE